MRFLDEYRGRPTALADHLPWALVFWITALFMVPGMVMAVLVKEPAAGEGAPRTLRQAVVEPFLKGSMKCCVTKPVCL